MADTFSNFIPEETIREIRETCSIVEVISQYVSLKKVGRNHKGLCPFHNEKTPSFVVSEDKNFFHCFGCGASGDVFSFLMKHDGLNFQEAVKILADRTGVVVPQKPLSPREKKQKSEREKLFEINETAAQLYHERLLDDRRAAEARRYLQNRGISRETIEAFRLGFAPNSWETIAGSLENDARALQLALKAGLIISKKSGQYYDRFRNRIMFPIFNVSRRIIGFGGRIIGSGEPKYLNSPESAVFSKRHNLYGLHAAGEAVRREGAAILVEGYFDVLTMYQNGLKNTVAALGTSLTEQQAGILRRYTPDIVAVFDADSAGEKAMIRSLEPFQKQGVAARLVMLPEGDDPDSYVRRHGAGAFSERIEKAGLLFDYVIESVLQRHDLTSPEGIVSACREIAPLLKNIEDTFKRELYVQKLSQRLGVRETRLLDILADKNKGVPAPTEKNTVSLKNAEHTIVQLLIAKPALLQAIDADELINDFSSSDLSAIVAALREMHRQTGVIDIPGLVEKLSDNTQRQLVAQLSVQEEFPEETVNKAFEDCVRDIRLKKTDRKLNKVSALLKQAEATKNNDLSLRYLREKQSLLREQKGIRNLKINFHHI